MRRGFRLRFVGLDSHLAAVDVHFIQLPPPQKHSEWIETRGDPMRIREVIALRPFSARKPSLAADKNPVLRIGE
ncbi:MAG: hypothetical protein QOK24_665 [Verrucomicrobiota bacterium]|jgi:hypothetical protein